MCGEEIFNYYARSLWKYYLDKRIDLCEKCLIILDKEIRKFEDMMKIQEQEKKLFLENLLKAKYQQIKKGIEMCDKRESI